MKPEYRESQLFRDPEQMVQYNPSGCAISDDLSPASRFFSSSDVNHDTCTSSTDWFAELPPLEQSQQFQSPYSNQQTPILQYQGTQQAQQQTFHNQPLPQHGRNSHHLHQPGMQSQQTTPYGMDSTSSQPPQQHGQAQCASSGSCPWVMSPVPNPDGWSLQQCSDLGCGADVPDVEQCVPSQSSAQTTPAAYPLPNPVDFTTSPSRSPSTSARSPYASSPKHQPVHLPKQHQVSGPPTSRKRRSSPAPTNDAVPDRAPPMDSTTAKTKARPTKVAHSVVEQRYRDNLNGKIAQLHKTLSTTKGSGSSSSDEGEDAALPRTRKADVLGSAIDYIKRAEKGRTSLENEVEFLKMRITNLEKLVKCEDCSIMTQMNAMRLQAGYMV